MENETITVGAWVIGVEAWNKSPGIILQDTEHNGYPAWYYINCANTHVTILKQYVVSYTPTQEDKDRLQPQFVEYMLGVMKQ